MLGIAVFHSYLKVSVLFGSRLGIPGIRDPPHFILFITFFVTILILNFEIRI
jgi:hypothetical protein